MPTGPQPKTTGVAGSCLLTLPPSQQILPLSLGSKIVMTLILLMSSERRIITNQKAIQWPEISELQLLTV